MVVVFVFATVVSFSGAWFMSRFAYRFGLIDFPNDRSSHLLPTPRGGGIGILVAFMTVSMCLRLPLYAWLPASLLAVVSFFDDRLNLAPRARLLFQFIAAFATIIPHFLSLQLTWPTLVIFAIPLAIYLAGTANFYNFMDGINGIAGMSGMVAFVLLAYFSFSNRQNDLALQMLALSAASLGFLPLNIPVARVFMGDVGSILLGFTFASATIALSCSIADFVALTSCLFPFYADTISTLYIRWKAGEKLSKAHRRHLYQILVNRLGWPHWKVSLCYAVLQLIIGAISLAIKFQAVYLICFLTGCFFAWCLCMRMVRVKYELSASRN